MLNSDVLVVNREPGTELQNFFSGQGFRVRTAHSAEQAQQLIEQRVPDLAVLDTELTSPGGRSFVPWLSLHFPDVGILLLSRKRDLVDCVVGLEMGADDFIVTPFECREVLARARGVLRRIQSVSSDHTQPAHAELAWFGRCKVDLNRRVMFDAEGAKVPICSSDFDLLALFAQHPRQPMTREQILAASAGKGMDVFDRRIDARVMRLRRLVEQDPKRPEIIRTIRGYGYVFDPPSSLP